MMNIIIGLLLIFVGFKIISIVLKRGMSRMEHISKIETAMLEKLVKFHEGAVKEMNEELCKRRFVEGTATEEEAEGHLKCDGCGEDNVVLLSHYKTGKFCGFCVEEGKHVEGYIDPLKEDNEK